MRLWHYLCGNLIFSLYIMMYSYRIFIIFLTVFLSFPTLTFWLLHRFIPRAIRQPPTTMQKNSASDIGSDRPTSMNWVRESSDARLSRSRASSASPRKMFTRTATTPACTGILGAENTGIDRWALQWRNRRYHRIGGVDQKLRIFVNLSHSEWTQPNQINRHLPGTRNVFGDTRWRLSHFHFARCSPSTSAGHLCQLEMGRNLSRLLNDQGRWSLMSVTTLTRWDKAHTHSSSPAGPCCKSRTLRSTRT